MTETKSLAGILDNRMLQVETRSETEVRAPQRAQRAHVRRRARRRRGVAVLVLVGLLLAIGGGSAIGYLSLRHQADEIQGSLLQQIQLGQLELEAGKTSLKQANSTQNAQLVTQAKAHFAAAKAHFEQARDIADNSQLLRRLDGLPTVGSMVLSRQAAVDAVSQMGVQLCLAAQDLSDIALTLIKPPAGQGRNVLQLFTSVQSKIGPVRNELQAALAAAREVDIALIPSEQRASLVRATGQIVTALGALDQFSALAPVMTEVLGGNGPRTYLIEQVNPAELRAGGGFIGTYSVLRADGGTFTLVQTGDAYSLADPRPAVGEPGYVTPPGPLREWLPNTSWSFVDSNFSPDFPSNAQQAVSFAQPKLKMHIDAVIAIDYYMVARMLAVTGPISVPGYGVTLTSDNFVSTVVGFDVNTLASTYASAVHKAILSAVAGPLLQRIVALPASQWPAMIAALNDAAASRNLEIYFNNGDVEKTMSQYGWSGSLLSSKAADYMYEIESNLGGTKANAYITRHYTVSLTRKGNVLHHSVVVDIKDDMPYIYRPLEFYRAYIRMYTSDKSTNASVDLVRPRYANPPPPTGTQMLDGWMNIHGYGHDRLVTFQWDTPWKGNGRDVEQIYWQKQPGTTADHVDVIWNDGSGHTYKVSGDLSNDRLITLSPRGVSLAQGQVGTAQLPSLGLG